MQKSAIKNTALVYRVLYKKYGENITPKMISKEANISLPYARTYIYIRKKGFDSAAKYFNYLKKNKTSASKPPNDIYRRRGFSSKQKYEKYLEEQRRQNQINFILSNLIVIRLYVLDKTKTQLAKELGVTRSAISRYTTGKTLPRKSLQSKLFKAIELSPKILEYLLH